MFHFEIPTCHTLPAQSRCAADTGRQGTVRDEETALDAAGPQGNGMGKTSAATPSVAWGLPLGTVSSPRTTLRNTTRGVNLLWHAFFFQKQN